MAVILLFFVTSLVRVSNGFYRNFPEDYNWGELFISYAGGFVRRGLTGSVLFFLAQHGVNIRLLCAVLAIIFPLFFIILLAYTLYKRVDIRFAAFIILSPTLYRSTIRLKDCIVMIVFALAAYLICKYKPSRQLFASVLLLLLAGILVHEQLLFYCPMLFFLIYASWSKEGLPAWRAVMFCVGALAVVVCTLYIFQGSRDTMVAIAQQWAEIIEGYKAGGGMTFLGKKIHIYRIDRILDSLWLKEFILAYVLAFLPLLLLGLDYEVHNKALGRFKIFSEKLFLFAVIAAPLAFTAVAADMGRLIALHSVSLAIFMVSLSKICAWRLRGHEDEIKINLYLFIPLLLIYALTWSIRVLHRTGDRLVVIDYNHAAMIIMAACIVYFFRKACTRAHSKADKAFE